MFRGLRREDATSRTSFPRGVSQSSAETRCPARRSVESVWGCYRARGDDSSGVSEVCEMCSAGPSHLSPCRSLSASSSCTGAETVGRTRRGANSVGQAVGGWSKSKFPSRQNQFTRQTERTGLSQRAGHQGTGQGKNIPTMPTDLQNAFADGRRC